MKTYSPKASEITRQWHIIDATGQSLGRLASRVACLLKGKHKAIYSPHLDTGDYVVVINASKVRVTGRKSTQKVYYRHSMYPGGLKAATFDQLLQSHPTRVIEHAVKGMLPRGPLGSILRRKLRVYPGEAHPHQGQVRAPNAEPVDGTEGQETRRSEP